MPSPEALDVLRLLKAHHNVLISGPPGTGKSRLLNEVAELFKLSAVPAHVPNADVPIPPAGAVASPEVAAVLPSPDRPVRGVFKTAFHQGTKYREFVRGLVPTVSAENTAFRMANGTLYEASLFASEPTQAALVIVDEINRGPAVQVFGDTIVAIEADKRLGTDGSVTPTSQSIRIIGDQGDLTDWHMPFAVFLIAAMNQADTSVEPLDVAFQRRWEPYRLKPNAAALATFLGIADPTAEPPAAAASAGDVYLAALRAWVKVNERITLGRGAEYQIGHGVFMAALPPDGASPAEALTFVNSGWNRVRAHVEEVFFGHVRGVAAALNIGLEGHPLKLEDSFFAGDPVVNISEPDDVDLYKVLRSVGSGTVG